MAQWKSSGLTSAQFCEGRDFTPGGLRYWSSRIRQETPAAPPPPPVRLARVVQVSKAQPAAVASSALVVELAGARISVHSGFDRATFEALVEVLAARGGAP